jgi:acyl-CoA thioesterase FadM
MIRPVGPGEDLRLEAQVVKLKESFGELRGLVYCGTELVAEGQLRFGIANARDVLPS